MFVQKLNPLTGEADWVLVNDPGLGDEDDASADLVATSSYLDMLTDTRRNVAYAAALRRVLPAKQQKQQHQRLAAPGAGAAAAVPSAPRIGGSASASGGDSEADGSARVLDIGTGTGLLAMLAARSLGLHGNVGGAASGTGAGVDGGSDGDAPTSAPVVACEVFPPMQNLARKVIAANGLQHAIRVVNKRSDEIVVRRPEEPSAAVAASAAAAPAASAAARARAAAAAKAAPAPDMDGRADVIVTEIFDSELLGEGMIPTMRHAVQHLLKEGGVVIPATSRVYGQLVQCPLMHNMTGLRHAAGGESAAAAWSTFGGGSAAAHDAASGAAAGRVLGVLGELDARARAAFFREDDLYEVREMHVDLLYQHAEEAARRCSGGQPTHGLPPGAAQAPQQPSGEATAAPPAPSELRPLSEPFLVFDFDWLRPPPPSGRRTTVQVPVTGDGAAHAVLLWWQLGMTPGDEARALQQQQQADGDRQEEEAAQQQQGSDPRDSPLLLSTAPCWVGGRPEAGGDGGPLEGAAQGWRDHWKQCWAQLSDDARPVHAGDVLSLSFEHDDLNIRTKLRTPTPPPQPAAPAPTPAAAAGTATSEEAAAASEGPSGSRGAQAVLAALQAEAAQQQLMPLLSWLGPQALLQLGDAKRLATFGAGLQAALAEAGAAASASGADASGSSSGSGCGSGAEVVVVDGSLALGLLAATHPAVASVTLLQESNVAAGNWLRAAAAALGVAGKIRSLRSDAYFKRLAARPAAAAAASGAAGAASAPAAAPPPLVLVSEPYFSEFEQLVPWAHLKFWRDYDVIRGSVAPAGGPGAKGGGRRRVASFPRRARLVAVAASLPELWRTRCALDRIEGLDLSAANTVLGVVGGECGSSGGAGSDNSSGSGSAAPGRAAGAADADADVWGDDGDSDGEAGAAGGTATGSTRQPLPILPYSVWQAGGGYVELTPRRELLSLDCGGHLEDAEGEAVLEATRGSVCHAIVLWMEYDLHGEREGQGGRQERLAVSTAPAADGGPGASVQGVYLLRRPVQLTRGSRLHVAAQFDGLDADVTVEVTVLPAVPEAAPEAAVVVSA